jgi:NADPH-dependent curcumin reductase CurA
MPGQQTRQWVLENPPKANPVVDGDNATFKLQTVTLPELGKDQVLVKVLWL